MRRVRGVVRGYARRFYQASVDHRGVPEYPGRVVTLLPDESAECWGVAYQVADADRERVLGELDEREKGGYTLLSVRFEARDRSFDGSLDPRVYIAGPENSNYVGVEPLETIAERVRNAVGPSGHNAEYVLRLAESLSELNAYDEHVFELANLVADLEGEDEGVTAGDE